MNVQVQNSGNGSAQAGVVLYLGMVRRGECECLERRGYPLALLHDTNSRHKLADVSRFAYMADFDFSRPLSELTQAVQEIQERLGIACLFNLGEYYVAQTAEVAAALGLPAISPVSARLCLDKDVMRRRFQERIGPDAAARFEIVTSEAGLLDCAAGLGYPVFLQPANLAASMWATRNTSPEMLLANYRAMVSEVPKYYQALGKPEARLTAVLAEYLQGANTSVDCIADGTGNVYTTPVVDVLTGQDVGIDDYHHFARIVPSRASAAEQQELARLAMAGVRALEMSMSVAHVEFIGTRLGEIAARPGGNRPRILELAFGIDELHAYYQILRGQTPDLSPTRNGAAAIITPFAHRNGTLRSIRGMERIASLPGYHYHEVRIQPGTPVGLSKDGYRAPLYIELVSENPDDVRRSVDQIASWTDLYDVE